MPPSVHMSFTMDTGSVATLITVRTIWPNSFMVSPCAPRQPSWLKSRLQFVRHFDHLKIARVVLVTVQLVGACLSEFFRLERAVIGERFVRIIAAEMIRVDNAIQHRVSLHRSASMICYGVKVRVSPSGPTTSSRLMPFVPPSMIRRKGGGHGRILIDRCWPAGAICIRSNACLRVIAHLQPIPAPAARAGHNVAHESDPMGRVGDTRAAVLQLLPSSRRQPWSAPSEPSDA